MSDSQRIDFRRLHIEAQQLRRRGFSSAEISSMWRIPRRYAELLGIWPIPGYSPVSISSTHPGETHE